MRKIAFWAASATALAAVVMSVPAQAAAPPGETTWEYIEGYRYADLGWTLKGRVEGRPGNYHSGTFNFEGDDDGVTAELIDWRCPVDVEPPTYFDAAHDCAVKASIWIQEQDFINTFHFGKKLRHNRIQITVPVEDSLRGDIAEEDLDLRIRGLKPLTRTVSFFFSEAAGMRFRYKEINRQRPAKFIGTIAWLDFSDPRLKVINPIVRAYDAWVELPGVPVEGLAR